MTATNESDTASAKGARAAALCVLVIDDNPNDRALTRRALDQEFPGIGIDEIGTAEQLEERLAAGAFDAVVTDYQLRWSDGLTVLQAVKARSSAIPVIMFTNTGNEEVAVEGMKQGLDDYIVKKAQNFTRVALALRRALDVCATRRLAARLETRLQSLLNQLNVGVFRATTDGVLLEANAAMLRLVRQRSVDQAQRVFQQSFALSTAERDSEWEARRGSGKPFEREIELRYENGSSAWVAVNEVITDADNETVVDGVVEDITHNKQLRERLRQAMVETHHRVKNSLQITAALIEMRATAHDGVVPVHELERTAQQIRALAGIHDLLTSKARDGEALVVSSRDTLERLITLMAQSAGSRHIHSDIADIPLVPRKATSLAIVTSELVLNGLKYSSGDVDVRFWRAQDSAVLAVSDHGPGFPASFDPLNAARTGLDLVWNLAKWDLNATLQFATAPEGGGVVTLTMPLAIDNSPA